MHFPWRGCLRGGARCAPTCRHPARAKHSFARKGVPKRSLGTRQTTPGAALPAQGSDSFCKLGVFWPRRSYPARNGIPTGLGGMATGGGGIAIARNGMAAGADGIHTAGRSIPTGGGGIHTGGNGMASQTRRYPYRTARYGYHWQWYGWGRRRYRCQSGRYRYRGARDRPSWPQFRQSAAHERPSP